MAEVIFASSYDDKHGIENILNPDKKQFWSSTGLYPQELFIQLQQEKTLSSVSITSYGIKKILIESCENDSAVNFVKQGEVADVPNKEGKLQEFSVECKAGKPVKILKICVLDGYEDFCSIHNVGFK
jgi:heat shock protein beta-11